MIQLVEKNEIAKRKQYKFSDKTKTKMIRKRKKKEIDKMNMVKIITKIDTLDEIVSEDIVCKNNYRSFYLR